MADGSRLLNFGPFKADDTLRLRSEDYFCRERAAALGTPDVKDGIVAVLEVLPKNRYWVIGERPMPLHYGPDRFIRFETDGSLWEKVG